MLQRTIQLGISLLHGGNRQVQKVNHPQFSLHRSMRSFEL